MPDFETLAARNGVERRATCHEVGADRFREARETIQGGLTWAVGGIVTDDAGRVLLVREDGRWLAPGGEVEDGETHEDALVRELREETGIEVTVGSPVAATEVVFASADECVSFWFAHYTATPETTALADDPGLSDEEIEAVAWRETVPQNTLDRDVIVANR